MFLNYIGKICCVRDEETRAKYRTLWYQARDVNCGCRISSSLSLTVVDTNFLTIYCHSLGGDIAAAYLIRHFIRHIIFSHHRATVQRPWRSLRSLSALVDECLQSRTMNSITIEVLQQQEVYELLCILDFDNVRKRMSVSSRQLSDDYRTLSQMAGDILFNPLWAH